MVILAFIFAAFQRTHIIPSLLQYRYSQKSAFDHFSHPLVRLPNYYSVFMKRMGNINNAKGKWNIKMGGEFMAQGKAWVPLLASVGIGAAAYQLMRPNNKVGKMIRNRVNKMWQQRELFPN